MLIAVEKHVLANGSEPTTGANIHVGDDAVSLTLTREGTKMILVFSDPQELAAFAVNLAISAGVLVERNAQRVKRPAVLVPQGSA